MVSVLCQLLLHERRGDVQSIRDSWGVTFESQPNSGNAHATACAPGQRYADRYTPAGTGIYFVQFSVPYYGSPGPLGSSATVVGVFDNFTFQ